ncbi:YhzD family protein [Ectobacillus antri]|jgi:hypothetical protein|uniref:YhzD family protein n=1 Tax=Ectobacillus antri TaxID=2486280 RepID=A0ABT6H3B5_9BACI|nr:YhzD family protein [Ectobacillus antri]MDG4656751.1 YhzD family protein [Ectobacillus antri]MDG5753886.1 YhzD family protein [Ectobacillus antri]
MGVYTITAYEKDGKKLIDKTFEAASEAEAKRIGEQLLREHHVYEQTHRCTSASGKLILFQR